jgi:hypothetical protein
MPGLLRNGEADPILISAIPILTLTLIFAFKSAAQDTKLAVSREAFEKQLGNVRDQQDQRRYERRNEKRRYQQEIQEQNDTSQRLSRN